MQAQFTHYTNENVPLLAFHGDVSIPEKWKAAKRLIDRWLELKVPVMVLYYGDLDPKGLEIPESARRDVLHFSCRYLHQKKRAEYATDQAFFDECMDIWVRDFGFERVGLNADQIDLYGVPENPERPGTYQWEGLDDSAAEILILEVEQYLDLDAFDAVTEKEDDITSQFRNHLGYLEFEEPEEE